MMNETPDFADPPIVELVLGAQFSPLTKLRAGHFGLFWKELEEAWTLPGDATTLEDQFELFDRPRWSTPTQLQLRLEPVRLPGRFTVGHRDGDRLLQIQATRFHLNWRRKVGGIYLSYKRLITEFEVMFARFAKFTEKAGLGTPALNQWELTYIDSFPRGEYWQTPADWAAFLPGLFGKLFPTDGLGLVLEHRAAEWSYEIEPKRGRLHISAGSGRAEEDNRDSLLLNTTARGPIGKDGVESLRAGLDLGHQAALIAFLRIVPDEIKDRWGRKS
ncbi:MAG: TIGR04255 family protein [Gemmataceae bacterium]